MHSPTRKRTDVGEDENEEDEEKEEETEVVAKKGKKKKKAEMNEEERANFRKKKENKREWKGKRDTIEDKEKLEDFIGKHAKEVARYVQAIYV